MHILVTSPIPSHPQNHGNRARVTALCKALQALGAEIHYIYGGLEQLSDQQELEMREAWEHVHILPPYRMEDRKKSHRKHHQIDDWYVDAVTGLTQRIINTWRIDYCIANYVWFSKWLETAPADIPKYIDTHDLFGGRHKRLRADGLPESWFSTTKQEEAKGFARADTVIAIQSEEAKLMRGMTETSVVTLGHFITPDFLPPADVQTALQAGKKITVGYMASDNPINQQSLVEMDSAIGHRGELLERFEFRLAGSICGAACARDTQFQKLGFVPDARSFYAACDVIINPNIGGTGLKIKSIEAAAYGKALVATADAMAGIESQFPAHALADASAIVDFLALMDPEQAIADGEKASKALVENYVADQSAAMQTLFPKLFDHKDKQPVGSGT